MIIKYTELLYPTNLENDYLESKIKRQYKTNEINICKNKT